MQLASPVDSLTDVAQRLDRAEIPYMVTGSVAGYFYGLNRSTADTDIVIELPPNRVRVFVAAFREGYFVDPLMVEDSARTGITFNIMPLAGGKFDMIPLKADLFERTKFGRRTTHDWHGYGVSVCTAPDLVLSKLHWARDSHSSKQFSDIRTIMAAEVFNEDDEYFQQWLDRLDLRGTLDACRTARHDT